MQKSTCPGCLLELPAVKNPIDKYYYNCSPECAMVFDAVQGVEFSNPILFSEVHQLTVDTYCVQHAGGRHPAKSVTIHLAGLFAWHEMNIASREIAKYLQLFVRNYQKEFNIRGGGEAGWPIFALPKSAYDMRISDVQNCASASEHDDVVRKWCASVWRAWADHHDEIGKLFRRFACP